MSWHSTVLASGLLAVSLAGCGEEDASVLVQVEFGELSIPAQADSLCLGLWDADPEGGSFGQRYVLSEGLSATLAVDPGQAESGQVIARLGHRGLEVDTANATLDFQEDVSLSVERCPPGRANAATERGSQPLTGSLVAVSQGGGGPWVAAVANGSGQVFQAGPGGLLELSVAPAQGEGTVLAVLAVDADNDCDDDLLVLEQAGPNLWRRQGGGFAVANELLPPAASVSSAGLVFDVNADLYQDLALVGSDGLEIWLGGEEGFAILPEAAGGADLSGATAVATEDLDGDGELDLIVGRSGTEGGIDRVLYGDGSGHFAIDESALPEALTRTSGVAVLDIDGDDINELVMVGIADPARAYQRDAARQYVDRSFLLLPSAETQNALGLASGDWNGDCKSDLLIAANEGESWTSGASGLVEEAPLPGALQVIIADVVGNGERDAIILGPDLLRWWKR